MVNRITVCFTILGLILAAGMLACSAPPTPPVRVGTNVWPGFEPLYLARSLGYFKDSEVRMVELSSSTQVIRAFRNDAIDVAALTLDEALLLAERDPDVRIIAVMDFSHGGDVLLGQPSLRTLADIRGRRIGVENTALGAYMLNRTLTFAGLASRDITIVPIEVNDHERTFLQQQIDALVTFDPVRSKLLAQGARVLFSSAQIPGQVMDVMIVRKPYLDAHLAEITRLLQAWFQALEHMNRQPLESASIMAMREHLSADAFLASLQGLRLPPLQKNLDMFANNAAALRSAAQKMTIVMRQQQLLRNPIDTLRLFDARPLQSIHP